MSRREKMAKKVSSGSFEKRIIDDCRKGDLEEFGKLFDLYGDKILNYIYNYINKDLDSSKDLLQETFISTYNNIHKLKKTESFQSWIYTIASNKCRDYLKKQKKYPIVNSEIIGLVEDTRSGNSTLSSDRIDMELIGHITGCMPIKLREVFVLKKYEDKRFDEIAEIMNCSLRTAKSRMKQAISFFTRELKKRGFDFES